VPGGETNKPGRLEELLARRRVHRASAEVARRMNAGDYDLAFVMQCRLVNSPYILRYLRIPSLYFCHEPFAKILEPHFRANDGRLQFLKVALLKWMAKKDAANARQARLICANSLFSQEAVYLHYGINPRLNYCGVDSALFRPLNLPRDRAVLAVGSLSPIKAQDFLIESVATLKTRPELRFIYNFDSKGYHAHLVRLAKRLGVQVSFECLVSDEDLAKAYNRAAITAFPSRLEPLGMVPLESMACETPVVGVAEGGIRETVKHGETGLLTERDPVDFGRAMERLLEDEALWRRTGARGRQDVVEHWTWDHSYTQLEKNMQRAVNRQKG
jgi:glycosyltransferase involved in cell wall biosynthesis